MDNNSEFDDTLFKQNLDNRIGFQCNFKCVLSIGMRCFSEIFLKGMNYKKFSCIFDASYMCSIENIIHLLKYDMKQTDFIFTEFSSNNIFKPLIEEHGNRSIHRIFNSSDNINDKKAYDKAMYPHYNLQNKEEWQHIERCMKRLQKIKNNNIRTLFFLCIHPHYSQDYRPSIKEIEELSEYLRHSFNCHLLVLYFDINSNKKWYSIKKTEFVTIINVCNNSVNFIDQKESLEEIFKFFSINTDDLLTYEQISSI